MSDEARRYFERIDELAKQKGAAKAVPEAETGKVDPRLAKLRGREKIKRR